MLNVHRVAGCRRRAKLCGVERLDPASDKAITTTSVAPVCGCFDVTSVFSLVDNIDICTKFEPWQAAGKPLGLVLTAVLEVGQCGPLG